MSAEDFSDRHLQQLAAQLGNAAIARGWWVATAESCTGGWVAQTITAVAGSSQWFDCGFVTYSNEAKQDLVGVKAATLARFGAVSERTVAEMARGALARSRAQLAVAVSGIAGPSGGTAEKPVGTVWFCWATAQGVTNSAQELFAGDREAVRRQSVARALRGLMELVDG